MRWFKSNNSGYASAEMLVVIGIFMFLVFGAVDYWTIMVKVGQVDNLKEYYLDRVRLEGRLSSHDEAEFSQKLTDILYEDIQITAVRTSDGSSIKESDGADRVLRNTINIDESEISFNVRCKPNPQPFFAGVLLGKIKTDFYIERGGRAISERANP